MIFFAHDYETTGVNPNKCGVVQAALCFVDVADDGSYEILEQDVQLLHPGEPIPRGASKVHGIYDKDVVAEPDFGAYLSKQFEVVAEFNPAGVIGFNSKRFDDKIAARFGMPDLPSLDLYTAANRFKAQGKLVKANLGDTYRGLTGRDPENAHDAFADIVMTLDLIQPSIAVSETGNLQGLMQWLNAPYGHPGMKMPFGKHKGKKLCNLPKGYVSWAMDNLDLSPDLKAGLSMVV